MSGPVRVQLSRRKGWTMPPDTIKVSRPTFYGNPFKIGRHYKRGGGGIPRWGWEFTYTEAFEGHQDDTYTTIADAIQAVDWYRWYVGKWSADSIRTAREKLGGKNLACWCALDQPCHADVLLELANPERMASSVSGQME